MGNMGKGLILIFLGSRMGLGNSPVCLPLKGMFTYAALKMGTTSLLLRWGKWEVRK